MITVTGASGLLGQLVVEVLLECLDSPSQLSVSTRNPDKVYQLAELGVTVHQADYSDIDTMIAAFQGTDRLLLISVGDTDIETRITLHRNAIQAAVEANVGRLVFTSLLDSDPESPFTYAAIFHDTEMQLQSSGLEWTILRPSVYADMEVPKAQEAIQTGVLTTPAGDGRVSYITRYDIARATGAVLVGEGHSEKTYYITGTAALSQTEIAEIISQISGKKVRYEPMTYEAYSALGASAGWPEFMVEAVTGFQLSKKENRWARVSDDVEKLTGTAPESFESLLRRMLI